MATWTFIISTAIFAWLTQRVGFGVANYFFHPLSAFPGPTAAKVTSWYKTFQEVFLGRSWIDVLVELHRQYGEVVRVGPNDLHFSNPSAYNDIYNNANRWDKDETLYHCFGEDRSSFGYLTFAEAKPRKDVLAPLFSRRAISQMQSLVREKCDKLCEALSAENASGRSSDMLFALRCYSLDIITAFCFAQDVNAISAPDFQAPIVLAMDASLPSFVVFRNFELVRRMVFSFPGWLTKITAPQLSGLVDLQQLLGKQVTEVVNHPENLKDTPHPIIYHRLLDKEANQASGVPSAGSLYEEAQCLLFAGADSAGNTAMFGLFHALSNPQVLSKLKAELKSAWPHLDKAPTFEELEKLPYLTAVVKESLRMAPGVPSPLPRIVPESGATISTQFIPASAVVGISPTFVHNSAKIFDEPKAFKPERWLQEDSSAMERWLVAFSKGPRACLGQSLAMCEMYFVLAALFRRFEITLDGTKESDLKWKEAFLPHFTGKHMRAFCKPAES